jgi:hypothetical protein
MAVPANKAVPVSAVVCAENEIRIGLEQRSDFSEVAALRRIMNRAAEGNAAPG